MKTREFLEVLPDLVRQQLPPELNGFQATRRITSLIKLYYERPSVHYEVWIQIRRKQVELGLHFEGAPDSNLRHLELLSQRSEEIQESLGPGVEIEKWDRGWTRVHETLPLEPLTDDFLVEVSFKLSGMMQALEPILRSQAQP
jgi:hypothetical protein